MTKTAVDFSLGEGEQLVLTGGSSIELAALKTVQAFIKQPALQCPKELYQSAPTTLFVTKMGGQIPSQVAGIQGELKWTSPNLPEQSLLWDVRYDADPKKGEHVNLKLWHKVLHEDGAQKHMIKAAFIAYDNSLDANTPFYTRITKKRVGAETSVIAYKPPLLGETLAHLTRESRYEYADCVALPAQQQEEYNRACARRILLLWCYRLRRDEFEPTSNGIYGEGEGVLKPGMDEDPVMVAILSAMGS